MQIRYKTQFVELYLAGVLGNRFPIWTNVEDCMRENIDHNDIGFRELGKAGGGAFEIVPYDKVIETAFKWFGKRYYLNASDRDHLDYLTIQGEINYDKGWYGFIGMPGPLRMRDMLKLGLAKPFKGLAVRASMRAFMDENSIDDIDSILDLYPTAVIEFACYRHTLGILPNRNTIIWEVRDY